MNLREFVRIINPEVKFDGYADIVREERYFCAVLFHCMLQDAAGLERFAEKIFSQFPGKEKGAIKGIFIEYAMARDLWKCLGKNNDAKKDYIVQMLSLDLPETSIEEFNRLFVAGKPSITDIQSPARWGIKTIFNKENHLKKETQKAACQLKWAFNVKPDIVIELDNNGVIRIEAKVESPEGNYANASEEKNAITKCLGADWLKENSKQCAVQRFLMEDVLGYDPVYDVFLSLKGKDKKGPANISWKEAFDCFSKDSWSAISQRLEKICN